MKQIERIRYLLKHLPKNDQKLGEKFIQGRDFEALKELVDSAICKIRKNVKEDTPKEEYLIIDLEELNNLKAEVDVYLACIEGVEILLEDNEYYTEEY